MARAAKKEKEVSLETVLWNCRVALRGIGSTEKNRDAVISLVFLKFAGDKFEKRRAELKEQYGDIPAFLEKVSFYNADNVFYLKETARWSYIVTHASSNDIAVILDQAMKDIEETNPSLRGALSSRDKDGNPNYTFFATLGASNTKIKDLIDNVNQIDEKRFQEEDLIGRVYEYFLQAYAASGTKEDGEFYTPSCVVKLIAEMIEPYSGVVYDPCCGSGGMFVQSLKFVDKHNGNRKKISILGQESNPDTWRLCKMNLAIRGIAHNLGEKNDSTFTNDQHKDKKVDFIMANPPFNLKGWRAEDELTDDPRFKGYKAMPPVANANYAWILHMLSKLDVNHGHAGFLLANGALNADDVEYTIRKEILARDRVEAIIVLPRDMFYTTDISVTLWIINMNKGAGLVNGKRLRDRTHEVLFMDLRRWDENIEEIVIDKGKKKKKVILTDGQIEKVKEVYSNWQGVDGLYSDVPEFCKTVKLYDSDLTDEEREKGEITIESKNYSLAPSKYIEFIDHDMEIDYEKEMIRIQKEMREVMKAEKKSQAMLEEAFRGLVMGLNKYKLGSLLELSEDKNSNLEYGINDVKGISIQKVFIETKADMNGVSLRPYYLVKPDDFAYVTVTSRNGEKITLAHNDTDNTYIVSSSYVVFRVKRPDLLLSEYLFMYFNRPEFDRYSRFNSWGSARETFSWDEMCDIDIELPSVDIQKKYVDTYLSMLENQRSYERGLDDLKLVCDAYIENLRREIACEKVGPYLEESDMRNDLGLEVGAVRGLATSKEMIPTKADMNGVSLTNYKTVLPHQIAYVPDTSRRGDKVSMGINGSSTPFLVSSISIVFGTKEGLIPEYLMLFLTRSEFDRYARFNSWGSARETFNFDDMCDVEIPIPDITIQRSIANIYEVYVERKEINERLKEQIRDLCPILIKGSIDEAS